MRKAPVPVSRLTSSRAGFSLIELMVVMSIIVLLVALLLPALMDVQESVRVAEVRSEITNLEKAIADFKSTFNTDPPSSIILYEVAADWTTDDAISNKTRAIFRSMWPSINVTTDHDFDGDGMMSGSITLNGPECLVFFLGGMMVDGVPIGFSKNPSDPFEVTDRANRLGPFHEFNRARLTDVNSNGMREYRDPIPGQTNPYVYISSNNGGGYSIDDLRRIPTDPMSLMMNDVYLQGTEPWKGKSYQIISPGFDYAYGTGGTFDPTTPDHSMPGRLAELDNITNFHNGLLGP